MADTNWKEAIEKSIERCKEMHITKPYTIYCNPADAEEIRANSCGNKVIATCFVQKDMIYICNPQWSGITTKEEEHVAGD